MVLITGANGLIGSFLCNHFKESGIQFKGLVRQGSDLSLLNGISEDDLVYGDLRDFEALVIAIREVTHVVHCAAVISFAPSDRQEMFDINVNGTKNLVNACLESGVKRFVQISSVAAIASRKGAAVTDETVQWPGTDTPSYYGVTKQQAELEVFRGAVEGLSTVCLNPSTVLGPGDWNRSSTRLFKYVWDEKKFYTKGSINFIDLRDLVRIIHQVTFSDIENERFIVSGGTMKYKDFFETIAVCFDKKPPSIKATKFLVNLSVIAEKIKSKLLFKRPLITRETARSSQKDLIYSNKKITERLNYSFHNEKETISWVCQQLVPTE